MNRRRGQQPAWYRIIERLEERILLSGDDTLATATSVLLTPNVPTQLSDSIDPLGDRDLYKVTLAAGDTLTADIDAATIGSHLDSYLRLFKATGNTAVEVDNDDDDGSTTDSLLSYTAVSAGTYYVGVSGTGTNPLYLPTLATDGTPGAPTINSMGINQSIGDYSLTLLVKPAIDAGATLSTAEQVQLAANVQQPVSGQISPAGDVDLYRVDLAAADRLNLDIEPGTNSGTLNRLVRVFNSAGVEVTSNVSGAATNANLNFIADAAGSYFVGVSDLGNANYNPNVAGSGNTTDAATGDYLLNLKVTPLGDVGDTLATAAPVSFLRDPNTVSGTPGTISRALDVDLYSVTLVAGDTLHLSVLSDASKGDALGGSALRFFDSAGNQIDSAVSNAGTNNPALTEAITTPGTYYVGVSSADNSNYNPLVANSGTAGSTGDYQLVVRVNSASSVSAEVEPNNVIGRPNIIGANANVAGAIGSAGDADFYMFNVTAPGLFTAAVNADAGSPLNARLTLLGSDQTPWQTSDDQAAGNQNPLITANLVPGTYFLKVESSAPSGTSLGATGAYHLQTKFVKAASAFDANATGVFFPTAIATGDFNGDHIPDLLVANSIAIQGLSTIVSLFLGQGDMSYSTPATSITVGQVPSAIVTGDFNHDGKLDFATANSADGTVSILLGNGDGTFAPQTQISVGPDPEAIVAADFNNDQILDLAVAEGGGGVKLLIGQGTAGIGNGTFTVGNGFAVGADPVDLIAVDLNHDNFPDLITANKQSNNVSVLLNAGGGQFLAARNYSVGTAPTSLTSADFNGDSVPDLAVANAGSFTVSTLLNAGNGTFVAGATIAVHQGPLPSIPTDGNFNSAIATGDFNHDGISDLIVTNSLDPYSVSVTLGQAGVNGAANDSFAVSRFASNAQEPWDISVGDFDNDGVVDVAISDHTNNTVSVFAGLNDGTFRVVPRNLTGVAPTGIVSADLNHDGVPDLVTANSDGASVLLGHGDGTFADQLTESLGHVNAVATGDFNQDNNTDLVTVGYTSDTSGTQTNEIEVLLGIGDGTYDALPPIVFGSKLSAVVVGDFNHDGLSDLAVTSQFGNSVTVLLANKDAAGHFSGTFTQQAPIIVGLQPDAIVTGDFDHDGHTDLAVANFADGTVSLLLGNDQGLFVVQPALTVGESPTALAVGDFNHDGVDDVAVANSGSGRLSILFGAANRDFAKANFNSFSLPAGINPRSIVVADLNGDGLDDIAAANTTSNTVSVYLNLGNGTFAPQQQFNVATNSSSGSGPYAIVASDFNHDGHADLATVNTLSQNVSILIGSADPNSDIVLPPGPTGAGRRVPGVKFDAAPLPQTSAVNTAPLLIDLNGDGTPDSLVMDAAGNVLLRLGRADVLGTFQSSQIVAANAASYATFQDGGQTLLGVLDRDGVTLRLYRFAKDGTAVLVSTTNLQGQGNPIRYDRIIASRLNSDNRDDLIAVSSAGHTVSMFLRSSTGFDVSGRKDVPVGDSPAGIVAANSGLNGAFELLVADQAFGTVNVVAGGFQSGATAIAYRASASPTGVQQLTSTPGEPGTPLVFDGAEAVATGDFNEDGIPDAIVVHRGTNSFSLLLGTNNGGLVNPVEFLAGSQPIAVQVADFNHDNHADLAVLNAGTHTVSIFLGDGHGHFTLKGNFDAGNSPTGLSVFDVTGDGNLDLMVGNSLGDVTTLPGNGDGTFQPFTRIDRSMSISVGDLDGDGKPDWVITDHTSDRLVVQNEQQAPGLTQTGSDGISAPAGVKVADLNGDGVMDMIVANSGSNQVLVYLGIKGSNGKATGQFAPPMAFFAGTDPVDVQVADVAGFHVDAKTGKLVTGDGIMDLVVTNAGSNDLSIFKGTGDASLLDPKPLVISTGGSDPVSTQVGDFNSDQIPDLLVTNHDSNNVTMLSGSGFGFFSPTPTVYNTGRGPTETLVGNFDSRPGLDFATLNFFSNSLTFYSGFNVGSRTDMSSGGTNPATAIAADFNNDGTLDLVVGNNGNGVFSVFEGSQAGLSLMNSFSDPSIDHPAALALAEFGQGQELQLLALGEGDELVHEFGRDTIVGPGNNGNSTLLVSLSELGTSTISSLFGGTSTGLSAFASLAAALGISVEGFFTQSSTTSSFEGSGTVVNRLFSLEIIDHLDSVITTGTLWLESTVQEFGSILGLDVDDKAITQTVEDVVSLLFPHLPLHALPSLIHNIIGKTNAKPSAAPLATDQAMENYDAEAWIGDANSEAEPGAGLSLDNLDVDSIDALSPGGTADRFAETWNITRRTDLADQLAGILAAGGGATFDGSPMAWNTSPEPRAAAVNVPTQRPVGVPKVVTLFDGTKRFGRAVPKVLVPPMGAASNRPLPSTAKPGVKSVGSAHPQRHAALAAAAALGTLGAAGYVNHSRRREKSAGGSRV